MGDIENRIPFKNITKSKKSDSITFYIASCSVFSIISIIAIVFSFSASSSGVNHIVKPENDFNISTMMPSLSPSLNTFVPTSPSGVPSISYSTGSPTFEPSMFITRLR